MFELRSGLVADGFGALVVLELVVDVVVVVWVVVLAGVAAEDGFVEGVDPVCRGPHGFGSG